MSFDILLYIDDGCTDDLLTFGGQYLPDSLTAALSATGHFGNIHYSTPVMYRGRLDGVANNHCRRSGDDIKLWQEVFAASDAPHLVKIFADSPFLDPGVIVSMKELHGEYLAEYTYSENLPTGLGCEIISRDLVTSLGDNENATQPLGQMVRANINQFDVELFYQAPDIRDKRISFRASSKRDRRIMERILTVNGSIPSYADLRAIIENNPQVLYIGPSYLELEITGRCDIDCLFCYRGFLTDNRGDMDPSLVEKILTDMRSLELPYSISLGGSGEPLLHPRFYQILGRIHDDPLVDTIIVETNGIHADANYRSFLADGKHKVRTIVNLNAVDGLSYQALHGADHFARVHENITALAADARGTQSLFLQVMKINETRQLPGMPEEGREYLDRYYDFWEPLGVPIILQKQNTFLGRITDRRYSDLSPLERVPCWHLQRDLFILADGRVAFCKQDCDGNQHCGALTDESIRQIWDKKQQNFLNDYRKQYPAQPDCASCDEWYTFNL